MEIVQYLHEQFEQNRGEQTALEMKRYMRGMFEFYGLKSPKRYEIFRAAVRLFPIQKHEDLRTISREVNKLEQRDFHHFGIFIWEKEKSQWQNNDFEFFGWLIEQNAWWDTVDYFINKVLAAYILKFPGHREKLNKDWNNSDSIWKIRASILYQLKYKENTDQNLLKNLILNQITHEDFFVRKAIGWVLREYSKTNPNFVLNFVNENNLSPLSKREALKWMKSKKVL